MTKYFETQFKLYKNRLINKPLNINSDLCDIIIMYIIEPPYKLLDWIPIKKLLNQIPFGNYFLCANFKALDFLEQYPDEIDWSGLSTNPNDRAIDLLEQNIDKIDWFFVAMNTNDRAKRLLEKIVSSSDLPFILAVLKRRNLNFLLQKHSDLSLILIKKQFQLNPDKINWTALSSISNDKVLILLEQNVDKIDWDYLSGNSNPKALKLLEQNVDKINWRNLCTNPSIFEIDQKRLKAAFNLKVAFNLKG